MAMRAGYLARLATGNGGYLDGDTGRLMDINGLSMGIGLSVLGVRTDYSFVPYGDLGNTHRVSFTSEF